jgi:hypothetical protein
MSSLCIRAQAVRRREVGCTQEPDLCCPWGPPHCPDAFGDVYYTNSAQHLQVEGAESSVDLKYLLGCSLLAPSRAPLCSLLPLAACAHQPQLQLLLACCDPSAHEVTCHWNLFDWFLSNTTWNSSLNHTADYSSGHQVPPRGPTSLALVLEHS